jgi:predicted transcriptional regulator
MERMKMEQRQAISETGEKIRRGYEEIKRGETVDARDVLAEIRAMSKAARKGAKKSK